ncbi:hypothetical protein M569_17070, partial [Genlisea aurea]
ITVVGSDGSPNYHVASRTTSENPVTITGSEPQNVTATPPVSVSVDTAPPPPPPPPGSSSSSIVKKRRGRPRKYAPDGSVALSPKPISSAAPPPVIDFTAGSKRGKIRSV